MATLTAVSGELTGGRADPENSSGRVSVLQCFVARLSQHVSGDKSTPVKKPTDRNPLSRLVFVGVSVRECLRVNESEKTLALAYTSIVLVTFVVTPYPDQVGDVEKTDRFLSPTRLTVGPES